MFGTFYAATGLYGTLSDLYGPVSGDYKLEQLNAEVLQAKTTPFVDVPVLYGLLKSFHKWCASLLSYIYHVQHAMLFQKCV